MSVKRTYILVSIPHDFSNKFFGLLKNVNILNNDYHNPIKIESITHEDEIVATPKVCAQPKLRRQCDSNSRPR